MAFTSGQLTALDKAIAAGQLRVEYDGRSVTYRSLDEMLRLRNLMAQELASTAPANGGRAFARSRYSKGL
jgi:hypothetical protein